VFIYVVIKPDTKEVIFAGYMDYACQNIILEGAIYIDYCQRERYIPIFLIVGGTAALSLQLLMLLLMILVACKENSFGLLISFVIMVFCAVVGVFSFAWFIAG